ncbi:MAG: asparagine--tRNA ligase [candidate division SR1 bacterium CG_4_9_14_3_um_filter_40_9]|nr:MAG: asparagine--tRNA ligase [candidate division SR1 bacterium CG_4_9_14_3_um_filter_40_9]
MKTTIAKIYKNYKSMLDTPVVLNGRVRSVRDSKTFGFIELNDGSHLKNIQIVFENNLANFDEICKLTTGSAISIEGTLVASQGAKQAFEVKAKKVTLIGDCPNDYPLQKKGHSFEYLREIAHLRTRSNTFSAVFRVRSMLAYAIHKFFNENGFIRVHTPIITGSDCEGAGQMFRVSTLDAVNPPKTKEGKADFSQDFFGKEASLTVSGQLEAETFATAFSKVYTFGPTFRAENSNTSRHLSEFRMIEPEIAFADLNDDMDLGEALLKYVFKYVLDNAPAEMNFFAQFINPEVKTRLENLVKADFTRVTYTEAIELLKKSGQKFDFKVERGMDMQTEHERYLCEKIFKGPVFVTNYPKDIKAFYMRMNEDGKTVAATDLLVPGVGEIIGGSQREERLEMLEKRIKDMKLDVNNYKRYLDLRKYGTVPHTGFGVGFERLMMYITGMENIRDVIPFPRAPKTCDF